MRSALKVAEAVAPCVLWVDEIEKALGGMGGEINLDDLALKRLQLIGVTFRTRSKDEVAAITAAMQRDLFPALAQGGFEMPIDQVFAWSDLPAAYEHMRSNQHFGKIVVAVQ
jgi:NADPH2:quinone reductase